MMKKLTALLLCLLLALAAGCAKESPASGGNVQIPNPIADCATLEEAAERTGFPMATNQTRRRLTQDLPTAFVGIKKGRQRGRSSQPSGRDGFLIVDA